MGQAILAIIVIISVASAIAFTATNQADWNVVVVSPKQGLAAVGEIVRPLTTVFSTTGTLVFYPNNVEPVPYIFYQDTNGRTVAKALTFPNGSPSDISSWTGARIAVEGMLDSEHVIVSRITYISGP